ncbi:MAG: YraN family protein [Dehalococcoidales bacterium]|nr:YraN family protein [Dehalococcoidales bacterium]
MERKSTGQLGENIAREFLKKKGYNILEKNYRCREGEVDIIARKGEYLVFVEVRTRTNQNFGIPEESINIEKERHLLVAANHYLQQNRRADCAWRIDVVAIELNRDNGVKRIELIENAVEGR